MFGIPTEVITGVLTLIGTILINRMGYVLPGQPAVPSTKPDPSPHLVNTGHPVLDTLANAVLNKDQIQQILLKGLQDLITPADPAKKVQADLQQIVGQQK